MAASSSAQSLLLDYPWHERLIGTNVFDRYSATQQLIEILTQSRYIEEEEQVLTENKNINNDNDELLSARSQWICSAVDRVLTDLDMTSAEPYLDIFHALFKDWRKSQLAADHTAQHLLSFLENHRNTQQWISRMLTLPNISPLFLHCLIDIVKISPPEECLGINVLITQVAALWRHSNISIVRRSLELVFRISRKYPEYYETADILEQLLSFANSVAACLTRQQLQILFDPRRTEFFYTPVNDSITIDRESLKLAAQIFVVCLKQHCCSAAAAASSEMSSRNMVVLLQMLQQIRNWTRYQSSEILLDLVFEIFGNDDSDAVNLQHDLLDIYTLLPQLSTDNNDNNNNNNDNANVARLLTLMCIHPHYLFLHFCQRTGMDYELLLDLLLTDETNFLLFLLRYLKYVETDPQSFVSICDKQGQRNAVRTMLLQLRSAIMKPGFPYNAKPLVNRMNRVLLHL